MSSSKKDFSLLLASPFRTKTNGLNHLWKTRPPERLMRLWETLKQEWKRLTAEAVDHSNEIPRPSAPGVHLSPALSGLWDTLPVPLNVHPKLSHKSAAAHHVSKVYRRQKPHRFENFEEKNNLWSR